MKMMRTILLDAYGPAQFEENLSSYKKELAQRASEHKTSHVDVACQLIDNLKNAAAINMDEDVVEVASFMFTLAAFELDGLILENI